MNESEKIRAIYDRMVRQGMIKEVPAKIVAIAREKFIRFFMSDEPRFTRINRDRISVRFNEYGLLRVTCTYYGCAYGMCYVIDGDDVRIPTMHD